MCKDSNKNETSLKKFLSTVTILHSNYRLVKLT